MKKTLYGLLLCVVIGLVVFAGYQMRGGKSDIPSEYQQYYVLKKFRIDGKTQKELVAQRNKMSIGFYKRYQQIEGEKGVYIAKSNFFSQDVLSGYAFRFQEEVGVQPQPFWSLIASPNYLTEVAKTHIDPALIKKAQEGVRIYLIPKSYTQQQQEKMKHFLKKYALNGLEKKYLIDTPFAQKKQIEFALYDDQEFYSRNHDQPIIKSPVVYLCTTQNMKYFENESLPANTMFENTYLKFANNSTLEKSLSTTVGKNLDTYQLEFTKAKDF